MIWPVKETAQWLPASAGLRAGPNHHKGAKWSLVTQSGKLVTADNNKG